MMSINTTSNRVWESHLTVTARFSIMSINKTSSVRKSSYSHSERYSIMSINKTSNRVWESHLTVTARYSIMSINKTSNREWESHLTVTVRDTQ